MRFDEEEIRALLRSRLSHKRYLHSLNVEIRAGELAPLYGADVDKARFAGLVHDICKDLSAEEQLRMIRGAGVEPETAVLRSPGLFHAMAGAVYLKNALKVEDSDILNAVRYHTTGRAGMSPLEETVYLADLTSAERDYPDADEARKYANLGAEEGMVYALQYIIRRLVKNKAPVCSDTANAYNWYIMRGKDEDKGR